MKHRAEHWGVSASALLALLLLTACASRPAVLTEVKIERVEIPVLQPIPQHLLRAHPVKPFPTGDLTVQELIRYVESLINTIEAYQLDRITLRDLSNSVGKPSNSRGVN